MKKYNNLLWSVIPTVGMVAAVSAVCIHIARSENKTKTPEVIWVGCPMVSNNDPYTPSQGWLPQYQIGFREDGVVVWRTNSNFKGYPK